MQSLVRWLLILAAIVALGVIGAASVMIREHRTVARDAQAVRGALAAGRPGWAAEPLGR